MGRLFGYMSNRADRLQDVLHQERQVIAPPEALRPAGWGVGFYQGGEVLHKKRPLLEGDKLDWDEMAADVRSDCVIVHLRQATVGDFRTENTHPFRMRSWLFAHNGTIDRFSNVQPRLLEQTPDFLRRNIRGATDSEHLFHTILAFLHDAGQLDNPEVEARPVIAALRSAITLVDQLSTEVGAAQATLNMLLTNGRRMIAVRRGSPMAFVERQGIHDPIDEGNRASQLGRLGRSEQSGMGLRYVLIQSDGPEHAAGFREIPEGSVCVVDRDLRVTVQSL